MIISNQNSITSPSDKEDVFNKVSPSKDKVNFDHFLHLLVTELRNQDPLKPLDPTQTVSQLASFSTVEQSIKTNTLLSQVVNRISSIQESIHISQSRATDNVQNSTV